MLVAEAVLDVATTSESVEASGLAILDDPQGRARASVLPAWPVLGYLAGFPLLWLTGVSIVAPVALGAVMAAFLLLHHDVRATPGVLVWTCLMGWIVVCGLSIAGLMQAVGYAQRTVELGTAGLAMAYYVNARERLSPMVLLRGFCVIWCTMIVLGWFAIYFPEARINTPLGRLLPGALLENELVHELARPRLAEIGQPWGAEEPFERPAAPFPYTNSWGMAYALLTPLMLVYWRRLRSPVARTALAAMFVASLFPAAQTSNRGMLIALGLLVVYVTVRYLLAGNLKAVVGAIVLAVVGFFAFSLTGVFENISERQEVSDTTSGRSAVYAATFEKIRESPFVGWATPKFDVTLGIALGTQGFAWMTMYSYGVVGLVLFYVFLIRVLGVSARFRGLDAYILHGLLCAVTVTIWFYGLGFTQLFILALIAGILSRASADGDSTTLCLA